MRSSFQLQIIASAAGRKEQKFCELMESSERMLMRNERILLCSSSAARWGTRLEMQQRAVLLFCRALAGSALGESTFPFEIQQVHAG